MRNALHYLATEPPDPGSECDYDPRRALSHLPPAQPLKILKLQTKFYKSKTYFGFFKVFSCLNVASSPIILKRHKVKLTPKRILLMPRLLCVMLLFFACL